MIRLVCAAALAIASAAPAMAQSATTSNVRISYEEPRSNNLRPVYERL